MNKEQSVEVTLELKIRFDGADDPVALKAHVLAWLEKEGFHDFVEGVIDGIDDDAEWADPDQLFESDSLPVLVFERDPQRLKDLKAGLRTEWGDALTIEENGILDTAWRHAWEVQRDFFETEKFFMRLNSKRNVQPAGKIELKLKQGLAFGDGRHATTEVALLVLEDVAKASPGRHDRNGGEGGRALDLGTGTGVLSMALFHLGFSSIVATDLDQEIIDEARANLRGTGAESMVDLRVTDQVPHGEGPFDLVVANILAPVLHQLLPAMVANLTIDGRIVLAGFIDKEARPLIERAAHLGFKVMIRREVRGWVGLVLSR